MAARKSSGGRKYGKAASKSVESAMHREKKGTLRSGRGGKKVTSRKQAIAIGLSEARKAGAKVPPAAIELAPLAYMRGRTLSNAFVILDEAQNATGTRRRPPFSSLRR